VENPLQQPPDLALHRQSDLGGRSGRIHMNHARTGKRWAIVEGYIPGHGSGDGRAFESHETACLLNAGGTDARVEITLYFADRDPVGPYRLIVPARRTVHLRFNDLTEPAPVPRDTDYASVIESDQPIVVQHTRLDSRQAELALLSTVGFPGD
jgi:hypothetical protein